MFSILGAAASLVRHLLRSARSRIAQDHSVALMSLVWASSEDHCVVIEITHAVIPLLGLLPSITRYISARVIADSALIASI